MANENEHQYDCVKIWYMLTLLAITLNRKFILLQCLQHQNLDFKIFPMIYHMPNLDNWVRNNDRLKFVCAEIWYMFNLLGLTFYRKSVLMQDLRHLKLSFKSFPTTYCIPNSDNQARNDNRLKFVVISNIQSRATGPQYGRVKCATPSRSSCAFYVTIPQYGRARLNVRNYCKL